MDIKAGDLEAIEDGDAFIRFFADYAQDVLHQARLYPRLSQLRVMEAHGAWLSDLKRVNEHEKNLAGGLDHFKRCGHLAFWVRRMGPVVESVETGSYQDSPGYDLSPDERDFRDLLFGYCNEYLAFDLGFQFCRYYEMNKPSGSARAACIVLSEEYIRTTCHFLKYKSVSPHALFLIYKSLFLVS